VLYDEALKKIMEDKVQIPSGRIKSLDEILIKTERALISKDGLPRRPWFAHLIYAPGFYTGYGVKTLPGVREALEQRNWKEANSQIEATSKVLEDCAGEIREAARILSQG
jgi:N-acetylated-alpha-linked acidic dipeptidase